jgi:hypothetical protein
MTYRFVLMALNSRIQLQYYLLNFPVLGGVNGIFKHNINYTLGCP